MDFVAWIPTPYRPSLFLNNIEEGRTGHAFVGMDIFILLR
jgi:hypothetical protein